MANTDDLRKLEEGADAWNEHNRGLTRQADLRMASPRRTDFKGFKFSNCDFSGAQLPGASFDDCSMQDVVARGVNFKRCSFVNSHLQEITCSATIFDESILRKTHILGVSLEDCSLDKVGFEDCIISDFLLTNAAAREIQFLGVTFNNFRYANSQNLEVKIQNCIINESLLRDVVLSKAYLQNVRFFRSQISDLQVLGGEITDCDFEDCTIISCYFQNEASAKQNSYTNSKIQNCDLSQLGISTASMLGASLIRCSWPNQQGKISFLGRYIPAPLLLKQPVQDLSGIPPVLRRQISDAQYLEHLFQSTYGLRHVMIHLWGMTTGFGSSFGRLCATTFTLFLGVLLAFVIADWPGWGVAELKVSFALHSKEALLALFSLSSERLGLTALQEDITIVARILGFLVLGLWINLVSNLLVRLGAG